MQNLIAKWIEAGASKEDALLLAKMYGAPKKPDPFLLRWNIHKDTWNRVACKANVKKIIKALGDDKIENIYISPAFGSVYIDTKDEVTIRVSNHERTSSDHAYPDFNIYNSSSMNAAILEITA